MTPIIDRRHKHSQHKQKAPVVKTPQQRSQRHERERREASERHKRKLEQATKQPEQELLKEKASDETT